MVYEVVLPQLGLTMEDGVVTSWQKPIGDRVEKGEFLFTVETDKVEMEVESSVTGFLNAIVVELGERVPVGTVIAYIGDQQGEIPPEDRLHSSVPTTGAAVEKSEAMASAASYGTEAATRSAKSDEAGVAISSEKFSVSPRARRLSKELGVDISLLQPSRGSRIVEEDVRRFHEQNTKSRVAGNGHDANRVSNARKVAAQRLSESFQRAPHFYVAVEANATALVSLREQLRGAVNLPRDSTYTDLLLRALAMALKEHPDVNTHWEDGTIRPAESVDVGFAVQTPAGLLVPLIRHADQMKFPDFLSARRSLTEKALTSKLGIQDMEGGSATLTNLGSHNVDWFQAVLNPPQSVILATGRIAKRATVIDESIRICPTLFLSLSVDHRVVDGVAAARFLSTIVKLIENPKVMIV
jgi:pyruvate dehydrogenase E2 component (dihydrolipoamide acetyltransferase)